MKNTIKNIYDWIVRNFSNIFSVVGIILTFYLSVFYAPRWIRDNENERIANAKKSLKESIKELAYSDSSFTFKDVAILYQAQESEINEKLPFSIEQILTESQGSFMEDKFLPLQNRRHFIYKIELAKKVDTANIKATNFYLKINKKSQSSDTSEFNTISMLSVFIGLIASILGAISLFVKQKRDKENQEEVNNEINEAYDSSFGIRSGEAFENAILKELKNYPNIEIIESKDGEFDLIFKFKKKFYFVEIKYLTQSSVGMSTFQRFAANLKGIEGEFWFIYNTGVTTLVRRHVNELISNGRHVELIHAPNMFSFKKKLTKLLS